MPQPRNPAATSSRPCTAQSVRRTKKAIKHFRREAEAIKRRAASLSGIQARVAAKQVNIYTKLGDCLSLISQTSETTGITATLMTKRRLSSRMRTDEDSRNDYTEYARLMAQAVTNGLADDPFIKEWQEMRSLLGDRDTLRLAKRGRETGIKRPVPPYEVALMAFIAERWQEGQSAETIREAILTENMLPAGKTLSREAIRKRILSLHLT